MDKHRRCTDILFLLLFVAFMIGLFAAGIFGFANGEVESKLGGFTTPQLVGEFFSIRAQLRCIHAVFEMQQSERRRW